MRGQRSTVGDTRIAPNGYHWTRTETGWRMTHHIVAEKEVLGRPLAADEMVQFIRGKEPLAENLRVIKKGKSSLRRRAAQLEVRIEELQAELSEVRAELEQAQTVS